jgi:hypothetical protein
MRHAIRTLYNHHSRLFVQTWLAAPNALREQRSDIG